MTKAYPNSIFENNHIIDSAEVDRLIAIGDTDSIILNHMRLLGAIAHSYARIFKMNAEDLFGAGICGLYNAIESYQNRSDKDMPFRAIAIRRINVEILVSDEVQKIVHIPQVMRHRYLKSIREGIDVPISEKTRRSINDILFGHTSLDAELYEDTQTTLLEMIPNPEKTHYEYLLDVIEKAMIACLTIEEQDMIYAMFFTDRKKHPIQEYAKQIGMPIGTLYRRKDTALDKIRCYIRQNDV